MKISGILFTVSVLTVIMLSPCFAGKSTQCVTNCETSAVCAPLTTCLSKKCEVSELQDCKSCVDSCCALKTDPADIERCTNITMQIQAILTK